MVEILSDGKLANYLQIMVTYFSRLLCNLNLSTLHLGIDNKSKGDLHLPYFFVSYNKFFSKEEFETNISAKRKKQIQFYF